MDRFTLDYYLDGIGWARAQIQVGSGTLDCDISDVGYCDALDGLCGALIELVLAVGEECDELDLDTGRETTRLDNRRTFVWPGEPWAYVWEIEFQPPETLVVGVKHYNSYPVKDDSTELNSVDGTCSIRQVAAAVIAALESLLASEGLVGYRAKWVEYEFPISRLLVLKRFVAEFDGQTISQELKQKLTVGDWKLDHESLFNLGTYNSA